MQRPPLGLPLMKGCRRNNLRVIMMLNKLSQGFAWQIDPLIERVSGRSPGRCPPLQYRHLAIAHLHEQICSARADAIADAKLRPETYAKAAGVALGPIQSISKGGSEPRPMYRMMAAPPGTRSVHVAAGVESVTADIAIVWEIR